MYQALNARPLITRIGPRDYLLAIIILGVSVSPEIPVPAIPGLGITIRFEDILLVTVGLAWLVWPRWGKRVSIPGFFKYFALYLMLAATLSVINGVVNDLPLLRSLFYLLKQLEVMLLGILVLALVSSDRNLKTISDLLLFAALLNAIWAFYQIGTGDFGPVFFTADLNKWRYGTSLIGQPSVLASGGYYLPAICLATANVLTHDRWRSKLGYGLLCGLFFVAMGGAVSRASILASFTAITLLVLLFSETSPRKYFAILIPSMAASGLILSLLSIPLIPRFLNAANGIKVRMTQWVPLVQDAFPQILIGHGAASMLPFFGNAESHNFFIRTMVVGGVLGFLLFILLLLTVCKHSVYLVNNTSSHYRKTLAMTALGVTVGYSIIALFQDAFLNVKIAEMFWISAGAMGGGLILHMKDQS